MLFPPTKAVDSKEVSALVAAHWDLTLGEVIKASQNHTFNAVDKKGTKFIVRATPAGNQQRTKDELGFVAGMANAGLAVAGPIPTKSGSLIAIGENELIVSVTNFAPGEEINFIEWKWATDPRIVAGVGTFLGRLHQQSRAFAKEHPEVLSRARKWNELHDGVMKDFAVHEDDAAVEGDPSSWGLLHGDLNPSNWFWQEDKGSIYVFDWDQYQKGWWEMDIAQACHAASLIDHAGKPLGGEPVPEVNSKKYIDAVVEAYEAVCGPNSIDRARLDRMLDLRADFYAAFTRQAYAEGGIPEDMAKFLEYLKNWLVKDGIFEAPAKKT